MLSTLILCDCVDVFFLFFFVLRGRWACTVPLTASAYEWLAVLVSLRDRS